MNTITSIQSLLVKQPNLKEKVILLMGAITHPVQTRRWLKFLKGNPILWDLAKSHPKLGIKIFRPYQSNHLDCSGRVNALIEHYQVLLPAGLGNFILQTAIHPKTVCEFAGKSGALYQLEISGGNMDNREGELVLWLKSNEVSLYRAAFSFFTRQGDAYIKIGCVQGVRADDGGSHVRFTTRDLYGCRPKNLMISVIRDLGNYFGCTGMVGIGNANRVIANPRDQGPAPDYDQTWEELGAIKAADGDFHLPCTGILKSHFDDIASKKRSEAKKKNALLESIFSSVRHALAQEGVPGSERAVLIESNGHVAEIGTSDVMSPDKSKKTH
jgi:uncharacterized protein